MKNLEMFFCFIFLLFLFLVIPELTIITEIHQAVYPEIVRFFLGEAAKNKVIFFSGPVNKKGGGD